jgi:beta-1,4-mannosyltransferase
MSICRKRNPDDKRIAVVVMGDVDRSPRMINHALSIATQTEGYSADMIGYKGNSLPQAVADNKRIRTRYLTTKFLKLIQKMPK